MRKSAQTFLRRAATSTRAMRRVPRRRDATHRTTAARPAHTSPTHRHACDCPRPLPLVLPPMPSHGCVDRRGSHRSPADAGTHRAVAHRRRAKRAPRRHCPRRYPTSRPACRAASAPRRKTGTDRSVDRMHQLPTARSNALPSRCCPATTSHRLRSDARGDAGDAGSGIAMQRMAPPTRGRWRPHRAAPKKKPAALGGRFGCRDGQSAQWPSSSSSSAYSSGDSSSFNCSASSASSTRIQPSP